MRTVSAKGNLAWPDGSAKGGRKESATIPTTWPRRLEGSDYLGHNQFVTMMAFWATCVAVFARRVVVENQRHFLDSEEVFPQSETPIDRAQVDVRIARIEELRDQYRIGQRGGARIPCVPLEIAYAGYRGLKSANLRSEGVPGFVQTRATIFLERSGSGQWLLRYLLWLIPSLGFIGTVVGIGDALLGTGEVLSSNPLQQQAAIQAIAGKLGTAFDTTFVALVLSIIGMFFMYRLQRTEEEMVHRSSERTLNALIDPNDNTAPEMSAPLPPNVKAPKEEEPRYVRRRRLRRLPRRRWVDIPAVLLASLLPFAGFALFHGDKSVVAQRAKIWVIWVWNNSITRQKTF